MSSRPDHGGTRWLTGDECEDHLADRGWRFLRLADGSAVNLSASELYEQPKLD